MRNVYAIAAWFDNISINEFSELRKIPELRKTFRWFKNDWFTEEEPGEECDGTLSEYIEKFY